MWCGGCEIWTIIPLCSGQWLFPLFLELQSFRYCFRSFWLSYSNTCFSMFFLNGNLGYVFLMRLFSSVGMAFLYIQGLGPVFQMVQGDRMILHANLEQWPMWGVGGEKTYCPKMLRLVGWSFFRKCISLPVGIWTLSEHQWLKKLVARDKSCFNLGIS